MTGMTERKSPVEQALDLFFYAPLGLLLNAQEVVPELIEKGHQQVMAARMFGKFAVHNQAPKALDDLQKQVQKVAEQFGGRKTPAAQPASSNGPAVPVTQTAAPVVSTAAPVAAPAPAHGPAAAGLAIPDYDSLSASQVVPRLEGLSSEELDSVRAYEAAHRGRKTILNKIVQLQG
jgi:hypothetical protein